MTKKEIAKCFSGGEVERIERFVSEDIVWTIYEDFQQLEGKQSVIEFFRNVAQYFKTITTNFQMFGIIEEGKKIAIAEKLNLLKTGKQLILLIPVTYTNSNMTIKF